MNFVFKDNSISVLAGENNTGKSSIAQSVLFKYGDKAVYIDNLTNNGALDYEAEILFEKDIPATILIKLDEICNGHDSAGTKIFKIIRYLLKSGKISDGSVLIIDEVETHLHPSWQIIIAEILVLIRKHLNVSILLSTHSPYVLHALEVYSDYYKIADQCYCYVVKGIDEVEDVTDCVDAIYSKFLAPIQILEDIEAELDS